jgi:hypothetical protein
MIPGKKKLIDFEPAADSCVLGSHRRPNPEGSPTESLFIVDAREIYDLILAARAGVAAFDYFASVASTRHGIRPDLDAREAITILKRKLEPFGAIP